MPLSGMGEGGFEPPTIRLLLTKLMRWFAPAEKKCSVLFQRFC
ncbi:MAG: hypothetical protein ACFFDK_10570 [Promethearchaeota archaeon]